MKFNSGTLIEYCNTNNITLLKSYENINRESYIEGKCIYNECENNFNKNFRQLVKTGAYCGDCMTKITNNKIRESKVKYDVNILNVFCDENNILLTDDYSNKFVNRDTIIEGICKNSDCENIFSKPFRQLLKINGYCENCSKENGKIKILETNIKKYGVDNAMKCQEFKDKQKQTIIINYGVEHQSQNSKIAEKMLKNSYKTKLYKLPSGKIISYQGYENFALDELLFEEKTNENDIITKRNNVPEIWYNDENNKCHRYYVDIYIKSQNRCIEVKSQWTHQMKNYILEKKNAAESLGYKYDLWIYDRKRNKIEL
jgi:hypothetical protein